MSMVEPKAELLRRAIVGDRVEFDGGDQPVILEPDFGMYPVLVDHEVHMILPGVDAFHRDVPFVWPAAE